MIRKSDSANAFPDATDDDDAVAEVVEIAFLNFARKRFCQFVPADHL